MDAETAKVFDTPSKFHHEGGTAVVYYTRGLDKVRDNDTVLLLVHGYPQSSYMWRYIIPLIPNEIALFICDIPGYGDSTTATSDKASHCRSILAALRHALPHPTPYTNLILAGHDRGARLIHRMIIEHSDYKSLPVRVVSGALTIRSAILLDIVPTLVQWRGFGFSSASQRSFHWPFLANVEIATQMIEKLGGGLWCKMSMERWRGTYAHGINRLEDGAMEVYAKHFEKSEVVRATCEDYRYGGNEEVRLQEEDQAAGRNIAVPTLVLYSSAFLGRDEKEVKRIWEDENWIRPGTEFKASPIEVKPDDGSIGHFIAEEAPDYVANKMVHWIERLNKKR